MQIHYYEDEYETVSDYHICSFHRLHPSEHLAGCTCSFSMRSRKRTPEEIAKIKAARQREHDNKILAEAELIKARRALEDKEQ